jgi:hypothetical protein
LRSILLEILSIVPGRNGGPVGGGGGGGRDPDARGKVGLPSGSGGIRLSGEVGDIGSKPIYEIRLVLIVGGDLGEVMVLSRAESVISSPDSDPGLGDRSCGGGAGRAKKINNEGYVAG